MQGRSDYHKLVLWQKGKEFIKLVYQKTENFPRSEIFGLQSQIRRASVSFLLNLVEGQRRTSSNKEFFRFLEISDSSLVEVEACLEISFELSYISQKDFQLLESQMMELAVMLNSFMEKIDSLKL